MAGGQVWTIGAILKWSEQYFGSHGAETPRLDAEVLLSHLLGEKRIYLYVHFDQPLTADELAKYKEDDYLIKDIWWSCEKSLNDFIDAIRLYAPRMLDNEDLIRRIKSSKDVEELWIISSKIKQNVGNIPVTEFSFIPEKEIDNIPLEWFKAAEWTLREAGEYVNLHIVKLHASDAYRQYVLDNP